MPNKMSGNKGEWSELYALFKILADGRIYAANDKAERIAEVYYPVVKATRDERQGSTVEYYINRDEGTIDLVVNGIKEGVIPKTTLEEKAEELLFEINMNSNSFEITQIEDFANSILIHKIKAPSTDKTDISLRIEDLYTNSQQDVGFSIKSELGHSPTLLNASKATNFIFTVRGLSEEDISRINAIDSRSKIKDRIGEIYSSRGSFSYAGMVSEVFEENLILIDSLLPDIVANMLLIAYSRDISSVKDLVEILACENPCGFKRADVYAYKIRKMLCACALGMKPSTLWDGSEEANGGYILVKKDGEVLAYHIYNREAFELYLLEHTCLERPSTSRHDYMSLYENNGEVQIKLNLQIRFK
ncbi:HpaII family restriction endonuclease [Anaerotardibacter muris]|uniref:HpaII family restriction endonuclease n=1 Tax=Anaerotardibacter muris TaxID=2941505 RepID=UPI002040A786|nr:HpaII family restriction endonuclease [Anaerotardibacter muris]